MSAHFADDSVFRSGNGSEVIEVIAPKRPDRRFVVAMDSWDAPEIGLRLTPEAAKALAEWLLSRLAESDSEVKR